MDSRARSENTVRGEKKSRNNQLSSLLFSNRESELVSVKIDFSRISLADQSVRGIEGKESRWTIHRLATNLQCRREISRPSSTSNTTIDEKSEPQCA